MYSQNRADSKANKATKIDKRTILSNSDEFDQLAPKPISIIIPEGFRDILSMDTETSARLCVNFVVDETCSLPY
jgi:hypothetical protein